MYYTRDHGFTVQPVSAQSIEITEARWKALLTGQAAGARIVAAQDGRPTLVVPPGVTLPAGVTP